jgi:hypothetical protein
MKASSFLSAAWTSAGTNALGVPPRRARPGQVLEMLLRRLAWRDGLVGVLVAQLGEREPAALHDLERARDRVRVGGEQPRHLRGRLDVPLGVRLEPEAGLRNRARLADAGEHVLQGAARGVVVEHVPGRDERGSGVAGESG